MKTITTFSILLLLLLSVSCTFEEEKLRTDTIKTEVNTYLSNSMELHNIPGLAVAIIEDNKVIYENYLGEASLESNTPIDKNTLFRTFSATKLISATGIFQLIQDGKLDLEDPISKYVDSLPAQWQPIKIKNLLSHSSGLPDIIRYESTLSDEELMDKLSKDNMSFVTGNQFQYNQTNYWLLAQVIEEITGMVFDDYILKEQFDSSKNGVLFSSNSQEVIPNRAIRYYYNPKIKTFEKDQNNSGQRGHSGNGLNITLEKFIEWNKQLDNNILLDEDTKNKMWEPFHFTNQKDQFLHGWGSYSVAGLPSYGFSGGNLVAFRKFKDSNTTIILLSNGYEIPAYDIIINDLARITIPELASKKLTLEKTVMESILKNEFDNATNHFNKLKEENPNADFDNVRWNINSLGNAYLYGEDNSKKALPVFKFNAKTHPKWWVALAGLAEVYEIEKDSTEAIKNYKKAISLNIDNEWNYNEEMSAKIELLKKG